MRRIKGGMVCLSMVGVLGGFVGCGSSSESSDTPPEGQQGQEQGFSEVLIDASDRVAYQYFDLGSGKVVSSLSEGDLGFKRTAFIMNGGDSGDGDVSMALASTPDGFYDANQEPIESAFVDAIPTEYESQLQTVQADANTTAFSSDIFTPAIASMNGWYEYNVNGDHRLTAKTDSWYLVQSAQKTEDKYTYAKFRVTDIVYPADTADAREIKIEAYVQTSDASSFSEIPAIASLDVAPDTSKCYLFETQSVNDCSGDWDIKAQRDGRKSYIKINTGASGSGSAKAMALGADYTTYDYGDALPSDITTVAYGWEEDTMESAFGAYNSSLGWGDYYNHKIYPNYRTYLLKSGDKTYALQISGYYNPQTEVSGFITLKYKEL